MVTSFMTSVTRGVCSNVRFGLWGIRDCLFGRREGIITEDVNSYVMLYDGPLLRWNR